MTGPNSTDDNNSQNKINDFSKDMEKTQGKIKNLDAAQKEQEEFNTETLDLIKEEDDKIAALHEAIGVLSNIITIVGDVILSKADIESFEKITDGIFNIPTKTDYAFNIKNKIHQKLSL